MFSKMPTFRYPFIRTFNLMSGSYSEARSASLKVCVSAFLQLSRFAMVSELADEDMTPVLLTVG